MSSQSTASTQDQPISARDYSAVPQELKQHSNWVVWRAPSKIPYNPADPNVAAKANDPSTWGAYQNAVTVATVEDFEIGFEFGGTDFVGIDFDNVLNNGEPEAYVVEILEQLGNPYCEVSPSETGLHAFVECAKLPGTKRKFSNGDHYGCEVYSGREKGRYFTVTGQRFSGSGVPKVPDIDLIYFLLSQIHKDKFKKLWLGDASDYGNDHSRADMALLRYLYRSLNKDIEKTEKYFSASELAQREKWTERADYRAMSLGRLLDDKTPPSQEREPGDDCEEPNQPDVNEPMQAVSRTGNTITPKRIKWLWDYKIPLGKITLFAGNPDNGKSLAVTSVAAICSTGRTFPDCPNTATTTGSDVLMLLGEDDLEDTAVPRLMAAGADMSKIHFVESVRRHTGEDTIKLDIDLPLISVEIDKHPNTRLIVIDPISNYLGAVSMVAEQDVRRVLIPLKQLAAQKNVAIVIVMHLNKKSELDAISRVGGAMAFIGVARSSWLFQRDEAAEDGTLSDTFSMTRIKNNLAKAAGGLCYKIEAKIIPVLGDDGVCAPYVQWGGVVQKSADAALSTKREPMGRPKDTNEKLQKAIRFLEDVLGDGGKPATWLYKQGNGKCDISRATLARAADKLRINRGEAPDWVWTMPTMNAVAEPAEADVTVDEGMFSR